MALNNKNTVIISGQEYAFKTGAETKTIQAVADYINSKMKEVESAGVDTSSQLRIAVLAAMNITAQLFECKKTKIQVFAGFVAYFGEQDISCNVLMFRKLLWKPNIILVISS